MKLTPENASAAIIKDENDNFLFQQRDSNKKIFFPNHVGLFGGAKLHNESYIKALKRELIEEIGFSPKKIKYFMNLKFDLKKNRKKEVNRFFYICTIKDLYKQKIILKEGKSSLIMSIRKLKIELCKKNNFVPYDQFAIWYYINKNLIS